MVIFWFEVEPEKDQKITEYDYKIRGNTEKQRKI